MNDFQGLFKDKVVSCKALGGGSIGSSFYIKTITKEFFLKQYSKKGVSEAEAKGLKELEAGNGDSLEVFYFDSYRIILNFINQNEKNCYFNRLLAKKLTQIHKVKGSSYGYIEDNFIGDNPQNNSFRSNWADFYLENRIEYQVNMATHKGYKLNKLYSKAKASIYNTLTDNQEEPTLIHGDLWGGNVISDFRGDPVLIDPAVYYGHRECDIAMTKLFGGFSSEFYIEYNKIYPLQNGWENRVDLYNLYHILNHLNLFGRSYLYQAESILKDYAFGA